MEHSKSSTYITLPRSQFVKGLALGGVLFSLGISPDRILATISQSYEQPILQGMEFNLEMAPQSRDLPI